MDNIELYHWGVQGMKWGVRRYQNKDGSLTKAGKKRYDKELAKTKAELKSVKEREKTKAKIDKLNAMKADVENRKKALGDSDTIDKAKNSIKKHSEEKKSKKRTIKDLSDAELQAKVDRLQLEKRYRDLMKESVPKESKKGKEFVSDVLDKSGKNIPIQLTTYVMGSGVNKVLGDIFNDELVVNPKKGQEDK